MILFRLNEGFASWVEILGLNNANPEFQALSVFVTGKNKKKTKNSWKSLVHFLNSNGSTCTCDGQSFYKSSD